jgi:hypothetical protein
MLHTDHCGIHDVRVRQQNPFNLRRRDLKAPDFDQLFLPIDDIPFLRFAFAIADISSLEETFGVERFSIGFWVFEIATRDCGTAKTKFSYYAVSRDIFTVVIDYP